MPDEVHVVRRQDFGERGRRRRIIGSRKDGPDRGVLRAKSPERIADRAVFVRRAQLIVSRHRVEEPNPVRSAGVAIGIAGVERLGIEFDGCLGVPGGQHHLLKGDVVRHRGTFGPIVPVIADSHDGVSRIEIAHPERQPRREPGLRAHGSGIARGPVLVVPHQHEVIAAFRVSLVVPGRIVEGRRHRDQPAMRLERGAQFRQERQHILVGGIGELLEVDGERLEGYCAR